MSHVHVIEQVPADYYQKGIANNYLQKTWHTRKLIAVLNSIPQGYKPQKILDVGCASGWFVSQLANEFPNAKSHGIDLYGKAIQYGKKVYPHIEFKTADAHKIPYGSQFFDLIICTEVLEHVDDPEKVLKEIHRVLKKSGIAIIELDSGSPLFSVAWYLWREVNGKVWKDSHLHSFNPSKLDKMIQGSKFKIIKKAKFNLGMAMIFVIMK